MTPARDSAWEDAAARDLVERVARARAGGFGGTDLRSFRARGEGHVYYLFDPGELPVGTGGRPVVARADQVAVRVAWTAGGAWRQRVVGRRSRTYLPVDLRYHLDHLTVVMENFGARISLGQGSEVRGIPHPASRPGLARYAYRLADSLRIRVGEEEVRRLYRVEFRPRDPDAPAAVGEMFLDAVRPAVARMSFTFTPASYRDPQVDHITVDLQSALVDGRHWLPARQEVTVRRQLRWLDFPAGGTIRVRMRIFDHELNVPVPSAAVSGPRVTFAPDTALAGYDAWTSGLLAATGADETAGADVSVAAIRSRAREILFRRRLAGTAPLRFHVPDASHVFRVRRGEGVLLGGGGAWDTDGGRWTAWVGHPLGRERPEARLAYRAADDGLRPGGTACFRCLEDVGPFPAASGAVATLSALFLGEDFRDPFFRSGVEARLSGPLAGGRARLSVGVDRVEPAGAVPGPWEADEVRRVRRVAEADFARLGLRLEGPLGRAASTAWRLEAHGEAAAELGGAFDHVRALVRIAGERAPASASPAWSLRVAAGAAAGRLPPHRLFLLGGRGTLPGYPFRAVGGAHVALARGSVSAPVQHPWLTARAGAAAGWAGPGGPGEAASERMGVAGTGAPRVSVRAGVGLFYDLLRVELARGLGEGGSWSWNVSLREDFWPVL